MYWSSMNRNHGTPCSQINERATTLELSSKGIIRVQAGSKCGLEISTERNEKSEFTPFETELRGEKTGYA